jgi:diaminohydroxyphosphoribosylaminopyrimidine deaminase/5-amino-6-(5-phosphoribosylamino)uracil reductase
MSPLNDGVDHRYMSLALRLAERGLGRVWPNPAVGCVLVKDGKIVGRGWTQPPPGPHAEVEALRQAGEKAFGATAYVTLEPCCHYGRTAPCTMALIHAGVVRVFVATPDPFPRVDGRGIEQLRQARIEVAIGLCRAEAETLNAGFINAVKEKRPLVTLKFAASLDGRIATRTGASQWITGPDARAFGHQLRARHDAILVGSGTALADDPSLTCRLPGLEQHSPIRVVLDSRLRLSASSRLANSARDHPAWLLTTRPEPEGAALEAKGVTLIRLDGGETGRLDIEAALSTLAARGITRLLVEGGAEIAAALLRRHLVDRLIWFQAPLLLGAGGRPAIEALSVDAVADAPVFRRISAEWLASDGVATYITRIDEDGTPGTAPRTTTP